MVEVDAAAVEVDAAAVEVDAAAVEVAAAAERERPVVTVVVMADLAVADLECNETLSSDG